MTEENYDDGKSSAIYSRRIPISSVSHRRGKVRRNDCSEFVRIPVRTYLYIY